MLLRPIIQGDTRDLFSKSVTKQIAIAHTEIKPMKNQLDKCVTHVAVFFSSFSPPKI